MNGDLQSKISPYTSQQSRDFSDAKVNTAAKAKDASPTSSTSFQDLISNSNDDVIRQRTAQKNGDGMKTAKTDAEFAAMMKDKLNKDNLRKPENELDKNAFLKLFITQMQNQDPLSPDNSSEMAAQLAQFHGLEQMMNVNKNLEKMQSDAGVSRAVGLIDFVGKDIKLNNGKLSVVDGKVSEGVMSLESDTPNATLEVRDSAGAVIATRDLGTLNKGDHDVEWDGIDNEGKKVGGGIYTFAVLAKDVQGQDVPVKITSLVKVTGVDLKDAGGSFYTDLGKVRIDEVASVGGPGLFGKRQKADKEKDQKTESVAPAADGAPKAAATEGPNAQANSDSKGAGAETFVPPPAANPEVQAEVKREPKVEPKPEGQGDNSEIRAASLPPPLMEIPFVGG